MNDLLKFFLSFGTPTIILTIIIYLLIDKPDRALKLKALFTQPFFKFCRWFSKSHLASKISSQANQFLSSSVFSELTHADNYRIKVKWVQEANDPILSENGALILRIKEDDDQTRNILAAVHSALPHILCPLMRKNINNTCQKSLDLTILKKLSSKLGKHGKITFKKYFLDPETELDSEISSVVSKLQKLDDAGVLIPIFINEIDMLSEGLFADGDDADYTNETLAFIDYLEKIVDREIGEEIDLTYYNPPFRVSTILLAIALRAEGEGMRPYLRRLGINLDSGSDSIYIISYQQAFDFFKRVLKAIDSEERVFLKKVVSSKITTNLGVHSDDLKIAILTRNELFTSESFEAKLQLNNISVGSVVRGNLEDISHNEALVNVLGMRAYIQKGECAWTTISSCSDVLQMGTEYEFIVKSIDKSSGAIYLSYKKEENNPWNKIEIPPVDSVINVRITSCGTNYHRAIYNDILEVYIDHNEISWFILSRELCMQYIGKMCEVKVVEVDNANQKLFCSIRQIEQDPWPIIKSSLEVGTEFNGKVIGKSPHFVVVQLPNNYIGRIQREDLVKAGHEYANFSENIIIGQGVDVYVSKVFPVKQFIRLDLSRNRAKAPSKY